MNRTKTLAYAHTVHDITQALTALVIVSLCVYGILVFTIVQRVAIRQHAEAAITEKTLALSDLEAEYMAAKNSITNDSLADKGFTTVTAKSYITNRTLGLSSRSLE